MLPISFVYGSFKRELLCLSEAENRQWCCSRPAASLPPPPPAFPAHRHSHAQVVFGTNMDEDTTIAITMPKSSWHGDSAGFCG
jgi:hypothetical protein